MIKFVIFFANLVLQHTSVPKLVDFKAKGTPKTIYHTNALLIRLILVIVNHGALLDTCVLVEEGAGHTLDTVVRGALAT